MTNEITGEMTDEMTGEKRTGQRILISGYYGFENGGDEAIALSIARELQARGHTPVFLSANPEHTTRLCGPETQAEAAPRMQPLSIWREMRRCDRFWSGGGSLLQDKTSARNLSYYLGLLRLAKMLKKPTCVFNQSIGPLSVQGGVRVRKALQGTALLVRDKGSLRTLETLGLESKLGGDPALLLQPSPELVPTPENVIIAPRGDIAETLEPLRELTRELRAQGRQVVALALMPEVDGEAARSLGANTVMESADPQTLLDTIATSSYVVGVRLHSLILSAAAGVPFAGLNYDPKVQGFCADAEAPVHSLNPDVGLLLAQVLEGVAPDKRAVAEMKERSQSSFDMALSAK